MSLISVHGMATNAVNLVEAYRHLNITDPDIPDGDIVVAFYEYVDEGKRHNYISDRTQWATNALKTIANSRQSQLLAFILTIIPHLTKENVALLATPTSSASLLQSTNRVLEHQEGGDSYTAVPLASNSVQFPSAPVAPTSSIALTCLGSQPIVALISTSPNDLSETFQNKTFTTGWNSSSASAYEPSNISDSDGSHSEDTDVPEEIGGRFWDGTIFRCEDCCTPLEAGQCPNGHEMDSCYSCHKDFTPSICAAYCEDCHAARGSPCEDCVILDEEEDEDEEEIGKNRMIWDNNDWVWRCTICMWEIEADGENQGYCQCSAESIVAPDMDLSTAQLGPGIELLYYPDYEPADSDSSGESVDTETDSGDESCIDDNNDDDEDIGESNATLPASPSDELPPPNEYATPTGGGGPITTLTPES